MGFAVSPGEVTGLRAQVGARRRGYSLQPVVASTASLDHALAGD